MVLLHGRTQLPEEDLHYITQFTLQPTLGQSCTRGQCNPEGLSFLHCKNRKSEGLTHRGTTSNGEGKTEKRGCDEVTVSDPW